MAEMTSDREAGSLSDAAINLHLNRFPEEWTESSVMFEAFRLEALRQTDRGIALITSSWLEHLLYVAISSRFRVTDDVTSAIFSDTGPLATFSGRVSMAYALGLIGRGAYHDLTYIRRVRNRFAHAMLRKTPGGKYEVVTFAHHQIADWIGNLSAPKKIPSVGWGYAGKDPPPNVDDPDDWIPRPRRMFVNTALHIASSLEISALWPADSSVRSSLNY